MTICKQVLQLQVLKLAEEYNIHNVQSFYYKQIISIVYHDFKLYKSVFLESLIKKVPTLTY